MDHTSRAFNIQIPSSRKKTVGRELVWGGTHAILMEMP